MKAECLTDVTIQEGRSRIVVELPNGQRMSVTGFIYDQDKKGEPIVVLKTGRKLTK